MRGLRFRNLGPFASLRLAGGRACPPPARNASQREAGGEAQKKIGCGFLEVLESEVLPQAIPFKSRSLLEIAWRSCVEAENLF